MAQCQISVFAFAMKLGRCKELFLSLSLHVEANASNILKVFDGAAEVALFRTLSLLLNNKIHAEFRIPWLNLWLNC